MMKSLSLISRRVGTRSLDAETGFIANSSDSFLLVALVDGITESGLSLFRRDTVISIEESGKTQLVRQSLLLRGCVIPDFIDAPIQTPVSAMEWLMNERFICGVYQEAEGSDFANFGKIVSVSDKAFAMCEIEPSGRWEGEPTIYDIADCTRISFLGKYELSLTRYGLDAAATPISTKVDS